MRTALVDLLEDLSTTPRKRLGLRVLQAVIGLSLLYRAATEFRFTGYLYGKEGAGAHSLGLRFGSLGIGLDHLFDWQYGPPLCYAVLAFLALLLVMGRTSRVTLLALFFTYVLITSRNPYIFDGGDNIAILGLSYMLLCLPPGRPSGSEWKTFLHNCGILALLAQIMLLYFVSGLMKASGEKWTNGTALYVISQATWRSLPALKDMFKNPIIATLAAYSTLVFQLWMPIAYFSPFRRLWIGIGCVFHLSIAVFMGLVTFSITMIGFELFLLSDEEIMWCFERARALWSSVRSPARAGFASVKNGVTPDS